MLTPCRRVSMTNRLAWLVISCASLLVACNPSKKYEKQIAETTRDPEAVKIRNGRVRTLWTAGGQRLVVYCADTNAPNAFGGMTGYRPTTLVISAKLNHPILKQVYMPGKVWINDRITADYYLTCMRSDTQRTDKDFMSVFPMPPLWSDEEAQRIDREVPVISQESAPSDR